MTGRPEQESDVPEEIEGSAAAQRDGEHGVEMLTDVAHCRLEAEGEEHDAGNHFADDPGLADAQHQIAGSSAGDQDDRDLKTKLNGELQVLDAKSNKSSGISITVPDDGLARRPSRVSAAGQIESVGLSPKGERALFTARGDIFTVGAEKGHHGGVEVCDAFQLGQELVAEPLYEYFVQKTRDILGHVEMGSFRKMMLVELVNDGPVTIMLDSRKLF